MSPLHEQLPQSNQCRCKLGRLGKRLTVTCFSKDKLIVFRQHMGMGSKSMCTG